MAAVTLSRDSCRPILPGFPASALSYLIPSFPHCSVGDLLCKPTWFRPVLPCWRHFDDFCLYLGRRCKFFAWPTRFRDTCLLFISVPHLTPDLPFLRTLPSHVCYLWAFANTALASSALTSPVSAQRKDSHTLQTRRGLNVMLPQSPACSLICNDAFHHVIIS